EAPPVERELGPDAADHGDEEARVRPLVGLEPVARLAGRATLIPRIPVPAIVTWTVAGAGPHRRVLPCTGAYRRDDHEAGVSQLGVGAAALGVKVVVGGLDRSSQRRPDRRWPVRTPGRNHDERALGAIRREVRVQSGMDVVTVRTAPRGAE